MVKGISRRVIVVESPDPRVFDQAIFILRNDVLGEDGVSSRQLVDQAVRIAKSYTRTQGLPPPKRHRLSPIIAAILGGGLMGLVWLAAALFVEAAEKPGKAFRRADNLLFSSFFLSLTGGPGSPGFFAFRRENSVVYWDKI